MTEPPPPDGSVLAGLGLPPRFVPTRIVGRGATGLVVAARDRERGEEVAVKIVRDLREEQRLCLLREMRAAETLHHPGLVKILHVDPEEGLVVMELAEGGSLRERIAAGRRLSAAEARDVGAELLAALAAVHRAGVVHRDVKPANILFTRDGRAKLGDFGIATFGDSQLTVADARPGTPAYMAPEQLDGWVDHRADIYAVAATLVEAITGTRPLPGPTAAGDAARQIQRVTRDRALGHTLAGALASNPADRPASAEELARALRRDEEVRDPAPPSRWWRRAGVAAAGAILAAAGVAVVAAGGGGSDLPEASLTRSAPAPAAPQQRPRVAIFALRTSDDAVDRRASSAASVLGVRLRYAGFEVVGEERLRARMAGDTQDVREWRASARTLDVTAVAEVSLVESDGRVSLEAWLEALDGEVLGWVTRDADAGALSHLLEVSAAEISEALAPAPTHRSAEARARIGVGLAHRFRQEEAARLLQDAARAPEPPAIAHVYLAVLAWWRSSPAAAVEAHVNAALALPLDAPGRAFLEGLRWLARHEYGEAVTLFRASVERFPQEPLLTYGLAEALFHGGHAVEGSAVMATLAARAPWFRIGLHHRLSHALAHGDDRTLVAGLDLLDALGRTEAAIWRARRLLAHGEHDAAIAELRRSRETTAIDGLTSLDYELLLAQLIAGRFDDLRLFADALYKPTRVLEREVAHRAVELARGTRRTLDLAAHPALDSAARGVRTGRQWQRLLLELAMIEVALGERGQAETLLATLEAIEGADAERPEVTLLRALVTGAAPTRDRPELVAIVDALAAERRADWSGAADAWARATAASADGLFSLIYATSRARALRHDGASAGVIEACAGVLRPRVATWSWSAVIRPCLSWTIEAAERRGDAPAATWARAQLDRLDGR